MRLTCLKSASVCHHHCYIKEQQTPKTSCVYSSMNLNSQNGHKGDNGLKAPTHKAARKFHVFWKGVAFRYTLLVSLMGGVAFFDPIFLSSSIIILNHESMMCVFIHYESIINE